MKTLYELLAYNRENKKLIENFLPLKSNIELKTLLDIIYSGQFVNNNDAMHLVFGHKKLSAFYKLKNELKQILIKSLLMQDAIYEHEYSRVNKALIEYRHALCAKVLYVQKSRHLSIIIAEKSLRNSIKFHLTEQVIILVKMLITHYGSGEINKNKLKKYLAIQNKYLRIQAWEIKAENYYLELQNIKLHSLASVNELIIEKAKEYVNDLEEITDINTYHFFINKYKVKAAYFEYKRDYISLLELSNNAIDELRNPTFQANISFQSINLRRVWALIQAGRNDEAIDIGNKDMKSKLPGSAGWYFIAHYTLKAYLYKKNYINAIGVINQMIDNPKFNHLTGNYQELFYTTLGYIHLIVDSGIAGDFKGKENILPKFKLYKFLNTVPVFTKDKRGINVSILLMHIAFLLQRQDYNTIIDRIDSLKQYAYKYLRKDDTFRSNCMIKMVIQMTKADFNIVRTERYTKDLFVQLQAVKLAGSGENIETEIIPHEVLWQIMLKSLEPAK